jgi:pyrroloquinoline quinone (PQQ) biosynthesis protein C
VTVLLGPELLQMCEERCGIARSSLTVVEHHIELDIEHAEEQLQHIDDVVGDPGYLEPIRDALRTTMEYHWRFLSDIDSMQLADMYERSDASMERHGGRPSDRPAA